MGAIKINIYAGNRIFMILVKFLFYVEIFSSRRKKTFLATKNNFPRDENFFLS